MISALDVTIKERKIDDTQSRRRNDEKNESDLRILELYFALWFPLGFQSSAGNFSLKNHFLLISFVSFFSDFFS